MSALVTKEDLGALAAALHNAAVAIQTNAAPPPSVSTSSLAARLTSVNNALPAIIETLHEHQGVETGIAGVLAALDKLGLPYVGAIREFVLAVPEAAETAHSWLPSVIFALTMFQPAATGIVGSGPGPWHGSPR